MRRQAAIFRGGDSSKFNEKYFESGEGKAARQALTDIFAKKYKGGKTYGELIGDEGVSIEVARAFASEVERSSAYGAAPEAVANQAKAK